MDEIREKILEHYQDHIASSFSCVEILDALYGVTCEGLLRPEDTFILSKGHAAPALYTILAMKGILKWDELPKYGLHCSHEAPGIPVTTGSLGCGLGIAAGVSLSKRLKGESGRVYVLVGDGELYEGSIWEGLRFAGEHSLKNLFLIVDWNQRSALRGSNKFSSDSLKYFHWTSWRVLNGHSILEIQRMLIMMVGSYKRRNPQILIISTTKGKGLKELETDPLCHVRKVIKGFVV